MKRMLSVALRGRIRILRFMKRSPQMASIGGIIYPMTTQLLNGSSNFTKNPLAHRSVGMTIRAEQEFGTAAGPFSPNVRRSGSAEVVVDVSTPIKWRGKYSEFGAQMAKKAGKKRGKYWQS